MATYALILIPAAEVVEDTQVLFEERNESKSDKWKITKKSLRWESNYIQLITIVERDYFQA
jgi:hypothetical protein